MSFRLRRFPRVRCEDGFNNNELKNKQYSQRASEKRGGYDSGNDRDKDKRIPKKYNQTDEKWTDAEAELYGL